MRQRRVFSAIAATICIAALLAAAPLGGRAGTTKDKPLTARTFIDLAKNVRPAVVSIKINVQTLEKIEQWKRKMEAHPKLRPQPALPPGMEDLPDWLKQFFEMPPLPHLPEPYKDLFKYPYGAGTGMIIRSDGYILTSRHVLYHPVLGKMFKKGQITVVLADKRKFTGDKVKVVATDPLTDLAVLKIDADNLPTIKWGDSDKLEIGEWVLAIGDPLELTGSVSQGIVSGTGREIEIASYLRLIQTTAVINPGNSGGPLLNLDGEVVGVNMAIASNTRFWQGIGFAVPSNVARKIATDLIESGHPVRGYIGIRMTDPAEFPAFAAHEGYEGDGVGVVEVYKGYPADKGGLKPYDIIVEIDGKKIKDNVAVQRLITAHRPGEKIKMKVYRGGKYKILTIVAGEWPSEKKLQAMLGTTGKAEEAEALRAEETGKGRIGLTVEDYPDDPNAPEEEKGAVIREIRPGSPAASAQPSLQVGDVIIEAEKERVHSAEEFADVVRKRLREWEKSEEKEEETLLLKVRRRGDGTGLVFVPLPAGE